MGHLVFALFIKLFSALDFRAGAFSCSLGFRLSDPFDALVNLRAFSRYASGFVDGWLGRLLTFAWRPSLPLDVRRRFLSDRKVVPERAYGG